MESKNGRIRIDAEELMDERWILLKERFVRNTDDPSDTHLYFVSNPMDQTPWRVFIGGPVPRPAGPPAEFTEILGERPIGDLGLINDWDLSLAQWLGPLRPSGRATEIAQAELNFAAYGLGAGRWFALRRANLDGKGDTAYKVAFPSAAHREVFATWPQKMYTIEAKLAITWPQFAVVIYQAALRQAGVTVENPAPFFDPSGLIPPAGH